jgi:hypothetical protein
MHETPIKLVIPRTMNKYLILLLLLLSVLAANAKTVKFSVDMTGQTVSPNGVHVAGDFQEEAGFEGGDWQSNTTLMTGEPGTEIYSVVVDIPAFAKYEYKFINGDQWYEVEFVPLESRVGYDYNDNRWVYIDSLYNDTTLISPVLFSGNAPMGYNLLRLKVDMALQEQISPAGVHVALDFQNFDPGTTVLYSFVDNVYEQIVYTEIWTDNSQCYYRFVNGNTESGLEDVPAECEQDGYRFIEIPKDSVMETVCFSACSDCNSIGTPEIPSLLTAVIYPNPFTESAKVEFNDPYYSHDVSIIDLLGNTKRVYKNCGTNSLTVLRDDLPTGIYFVKIESENRWLSTLRLVISQ